jgi:DNA (cytosine-5)-methyltransferase 1
MKHLGDITQISGYTAPIVDCIIGGSPCQDLSVAGNRAGLDGERSGLFMEQVRIVKEMRKRDEQNGRAADSIRPRYMVWENVPGAFSSNKGEDFRIVLEEIAKVADKDAVIPMPEKGKWTTSGCIVGDGWSIAWRVLDAQFWGVPQRRRRIALVADFGGESASEILFVRKGVSGDTQPSKQKRKEPSPDASRGIGADDSIGADQYNAMITGDTVSTLGVNCGMSHGRQCVLEPITFEAGIAAREGGHIYEGVSGTIRANAGDNQMSVAYTLQDREGKAGGGKGALIAKDLSATLRAGFAQTLFQPVYSVENHPNDSRVKIDEEGKVQALTSRMGTGGGNVPMVMQCYSKSKRAQTSTDNETWVESDTANTLNAFDVGDVRTTEAVVAYYIGNGQGHDAQRPDKELCKTLNCMVDPMKICVAVDCRNATEDSVNGALQSNSAHSLNGNNVVRTHYIVRRLTPLECERLQGYPDGWTDIGEWVDSNGKKRQTSDAVRYKALGNSIALPPWKWLLKRLCACYERDATMASLFDGIGGFPYLWEQLNGKGTCLWASEIEEFPIAVTKARIGDDT